jgi:two-component system NarL family sensor kinase
VHDPSLARADGTHLEVTDDGRGFTQRGTGVGLHAMRERAVELGGSCEIASAPEAGTTVAARLPREPADEATR